ncbi:hypothetical protein SAMN05444421_103176 [Celeribacter marinus]|uniref:Uncharacterized protein n=2 Tax=Celeribacter marinus TaxID=1397108 RepID=A0A0N9ZCD3_9RHOB|nr:hypothetical protein IMCC12053_379 [Celeribacter marinus]SFK35591.1 hypothetical protein SAMN05444421_103176 [Celeribacter marinus]
MEGYAPGNFSLNADGTGTFYSTAARHITYTRPITINGNSFCLPKINNWSGSCVSLTEQPDGKIKVTYKHGNNFGGNYIVRNFSL